jgi:hypothetical protein
LLLHSIEASQPEKQQMAFKVPHTAAVLVVAAAVALAADVKLTQQQASAFTQKVFAIASGPPVQKAGTRRTPISEGELNSWLAYDGQPLVPQGISEPKISMTGPGKVSGEAIVDLDVVAKKKSSGGVLDPWSYVGGRVPVSVTGTLHTQEGIGRFQVESAEISGVPVPKTLLQEVVAYYTRSDGHPNGINMDDSFELPAGISKIEVGQGQATVVQ